MSTARSRRDAERRRRDGLLRARVDDLAAHLATVASRAGHPDRLTDVDLVDLACRAEPHDPAVPGHVERLSGYACLIAGALGWDAERCDLLRRASILHDLGKVGVPDEVLTKDGVFTGDDRAQMEAHAELGHQLLSGSGSSLLDVAALIALHHHERVDGSGYPQGLRGRHIPVEARIVAIADVFDALTSERRYKRAMTTSQARALLITNRGAGFDAEPLDAFLDHLDEAVAIRQRRVEHSRARP